MIVLLNVSSEYKKTILADTRQFKVKCVIDQQTYTEEAIQSIDWSGSAISGETFAIGSAIATDVKLVFSRIIEGIAEAQEIKVDIGLVLPNGKVEYIPLGIFLVTSFDHKRNDNQTVIEGMDRFIRMEGLYKSNLQYPARIKDVAIEIANLAGVPLNQKSFERLSIERINEPEGYTLRQAIGLIAQFEAGFATFNRQGELEIRQLTNPNYRIKPANYYSKGLDKNEALYRINGIQVKTGKGEEVLKRGKLTGNQLILDNKVMTEHLLTIIYNRISSINFYPFQLKWQGDPALEAGDWLTIIDLKGNRFTVPNLHYSLSFNGGLSAQSSASQKSISQTTYQSRGVLNQIVEEIHGRISAEGGSFTYEGLDTPLNPREGDMWFKPNGVDTEIWLYKKDEQERLRWVLKVSTAENPEIREKLANQQTELENTKRQVTEADKKTQQAITEAGFAKNSLTAVQGHLTEIQAQATRALAESTKMKEEVGRSKESATNISREVDRVKGQLEQKVSQTEINAFRNRLESMNTLMSQTAQGLLAKADKTAIDALNRTVQSYQSSLTIQNNSIQSVVSETNGVKTKLSSLEQKQTGFQQTVLNQLNGVTTQQTQLADQITSVIEKVSDGKPNLFHQTKADLLRSSDLSRYKVVNGEQVKLYNDYGNQVLRFKGGVGVWLTKTENIRLTDSKPISFSIKTKNPGIYRLEVSVVYYNDKTEEFEKSFTVSNSIETILRFENIRFRTYTKEVTLGIKFIPKSGLDACIEWLKLEIGPECTPWRPSVDEEFTYEERSKITQSLDRINLAVQKGDLISQINIEAGKTLIQSKKILLDAETVVFKGSAFIPKATIKDFVVDTAEIRGTLDASRIRVINMDAGNLSTGYLNGNRIKANSITADKLATNAIQIGFNSYSDNLKLNPYSMDFYGGTQLKGKLTSEGMEFWYGSRKIGRIGESSKLGNDNVRGISMALENSGDYVTWSYRKNSTDNALTTMLTLDPKGRFTGKTGIHLDADVHMTKVKPGHDGAKEFLKFDIVKYGNYNYSGLVNDSEKTGIFMGGNWLYFLHENHVIPMEEIRKIIYTLKGLGSVAIPKSINSDGKVARWTTITL